MEPTTNVGPEEAAQEIFNHLTQTGYNLAEKVAVNHALRKLLRTEGEEQQKQLATLLNAL